MGVAASPPVEGGWQCRLLVESSASRNYGGGGSAASLWGSSASRICPGCNNQILLWIGCIDGLPWKLREEAALPFRLKLRRREQRHLLTPSTRSGTLGRGGWKTPQFTRDMVPPVTCGSRVDFVSTPTAGNFFFPGARDASTGRGCVSDTSQISMAAIMRQVS